MEDSARIIEAVDGNGKTLKLVVIKPGHQVLQNASMAYSLKVSSLIRQGAKGGERLLLRSEVEDHLVKTGIWTTEDANKLQSLSLGIRAAELSLQRGGIKLKEARDIAIKMGKNRSEIMALVGKRQQLDSVTIESVAENYKFAHLAIGCVLYADDRKPFFSGYDDYLRRSGEEVASKACAQLAEMIYGNVRDIHDQLFEMRWLKKAGFINDVGKFVNNEGHLVDENGQLVDEDGRLVNENGELVDRQGVRVTETGDFYCIDPKPFTDDEGNNVSIVMIEPPVIPKKPRTRKIKTKSKKKVTTKT